MKYIAIIVALVLIGFGIYSLSSKPENSTTNNSQTSQTSSNATTTVPDKATSTKPTSSSMQPISKHKVKIQTTKGDIVIELFDQDAPLAVNNFLTLTRKGFYNGTIFHRVIKGFMIQGGDPLANGTGGPGYTFADELDPNTPSAKLGYRKGTVAMANAGPNTNGSQFFIMLADYTKPPQYLPHNYTIFGRVIQGQSIVDAIGNVKTHAVSDKPVDGVFMTKVTVLE